eukprot:scaffold17291_cov127-Isochrysis_galbana.AAC.2
MGPASEVHGGILNSVGYIGARGMLVGWTGKPMRWGNDRTLTLHRGVSHLELRRRLSDGTGGEDLRIGKLRIETNWAAMDDSCGSGKAKDIKGPKPVGAHA